MGFWSGHGWGVDEDNCAEFCDHSHHFSVNGVTTGLTKAHPTAGNQDGCKTKADPQMVSLLKDRTFFLWCIERTLPCLRMLAGWSTNLLRENHWYPFWDGRRILVRQALLTSPHKGGTLIMSFYGELVDHQQPLTRSTKGYTPPWFSDIYGRSVCFRHLP